MRAFKTGVFAKWASRQGIVDVALVSKLLAKELLSFPVQVLARARQAGELIEIELTDYG